MVTRLAFRKRLRRRMMAELIGRSSAQPPYRTNFLFNSRWWKSGVAPRRVRASRDDREYRENLSEEQRAIGDASPVECSQTLPWAANRAESTTAHGASEPGDSP